MDNRCICCGDVIPEGRIVCWRCEHSQPEPDESKGENTMSKDEIIRKSEAETAQIGALIMSAASVVAYIVGEGLIDAAREKGDTYIIPDNEAHPPED